MKTKLLQTILLICVLLQSYFTQAQCALYGLHYNNTDQTEYLVKVDPTNGQTTLIGSIPGITGIAMSSGEIDPVRGSFIFMGIDTVGQKKMQVLNLNDASVIGQSNFNLLNANTLINPISGTIYILEGSSAANSLSIYSMNPANGNYTLEAQYLGLSAYLNNSAVIDPIRNEIHFVAADMSSNKVWMTVNLNTATFENPVPFSFAPGNLTEFQLNPTNGLIYALQWNSTQNMEYLVQIDPLSQQISTIGNIPEIKAILTSSGAINSSEGKYYVVGVDSLNAKYLYTIDIQNAAILNKVASPLSTLNGNFTEMHYTNLPPVTVEVSGMSICEGASAQLSGSIPDASYAWNTGETGLNILVSDSLEYELALNTSYGCVAVSEKVKINVFDCSLILDSVNAVLDSCVFDSSAIAQAYVGSFAFIGDSVQVNWNFVTIFGDTLSAQATYFLPLDGLYTISLTGICDSFRSADQFQDIILVNRQAAATPAMIQSNFRHYPNPAQEHLYLEWKGSGTVTHCQVLDLSGRVVLEQAIHEADHLWLQTNELQGIYFIQLRNNNMILHQFKQEFIRQ